MLQRTTLRSRFLILAFVLGVLSPIQTLAQNNKKKSLQCPNNCEPNGKCVANRCKCNLGFAGADCSFPYEQCSDGFTTCYNNAKCTPSTDTGSQSFYCDCNKIPNNPSPIVTEQCENPVDDVCEMGVSLSHYAFCTNSGKCLKLVESGKPHPGCDCPKEFEGRHCQYLEGTAPPAELLLVWNKDEDDEDPLEEFTDGSTKILVWIIVASAVILLCLAFFAYMVYARLKQISDKNMAKKITKIGVISLRDISLHSNEEEKFDDIILGPSDYSDDESDNAKHII